MAGCSICSTGVKVGEKITNSAMFYVFSRVAEMLLLSHYWTVYCQ